MVITEYRSVLTHVPVGGCCVSVRAGGGLVLLKGAAHAFKAHGPKAHWDSAYKLLGRSAYMEFECPLIAYMKRTLSKRTAQKWVPIGIRIRSECPLISND